MLSLLRVKNQNLHFVDRRNNNLSDVPDDVLASFKTLEEILLDSNHIRVLPKAFFRLCKVRKLSLSDNEINEIPLEIVNLINLVELDISRNDLITIPDNIKFLRQLRIVDFSSNLLKRISPSVVHLQNLTDLKLNDADITELPSDFGRLVNLTRLELRDNLLKALPSSFVSLKKLTCLDLGNNVIVDMPSCLCQLTILEELWLDSNEISALVSDIKKLKKLKCLDVAENDLEFFPEEISELESLTDLYASQNYLQLLPKQIGDLHELTVLKIDSNRLMSLPSSLGNCTKLQELVIKENEISSFPASIGQLTNLMTLIADCNKLSILPSEVCCLSKLTLLSLRDNCLYYLPEEIGMMKELKVLDICGNRLQYLPCSIVCLRLKALWLSENQHQPLLTLQRDFDSKTKRHTVTCYILPQQEYSADFTEISNDTEEKEVLNNRQRVEFEIDSEDELDKNAKLVRQTTPYPKDLQARVKSIPQRNKDVHDGEKEQSQRNASPAVTDSENTSLSFSPVCDEKEPREEPQIRSINGSSSQNSLLKMDEMELDTAKIVNSKKIYTSGSCINAKNEPDCRKSNFKKECQGNHHFESSEVLNIYVQRETSGLGLSIAGGKESPPYIDNDDGIFVSKIILGGPSHRAGLKVDDKILKINDVSMTDIDHYTAVQVLRNAGNSIRFTCLRNNQVLQNNYINKALPSVLNHNGTCNVIGNPAATLKSDIPISRATKINNSNFSSSDSIHAKDINTVNYMVLPDAVVSHNCNVKHSNAIPMKNTQVVIPSTNHQSTNPHLTAFEPDMTSTPLSLSRASFKEIPDVIQPPTMNSLRNSATCDTSDQYEGPVWTLTYEKPGHVPLLHELPPLTKALGQTSEVLIQSSFTETTRTRVTNNSRSTKDPFIELVTLTKQDGQLGLSIIGGSDHTCLPFGVRNPGIFISRIAPKGNAAKTGKVRVGDRILKVNDEDVTKATRYEAVSALSLPDDEVTLLIQHEPLPTGWLEVTMHKLPGESLGVEINGGLGGQRVNPFDYDDEGIFITKIYPSSSAMRNGTLKVGMRVIEVCNHSLLGVTYEEAHHELMLTGNIVSFIVCDGFNNDILNASYSCPPESSSVTIDSVPGLDSDEESDIFNPSNQELIAAEDKSIKAKVRDALHVVERLATPSPQFSVTPDSRRRKRTITVVLAKHTTHTLPIQQKQCPEATYLPCEV